MTSNKAAHVVTTTRKYKGKVYKAHLLRQSYREDGKVKNQTVANLSHLPEHVIDLVRRSLKGETFCSTEGAFEIVEDGSRLHGHVDAVLTTMKRLKFFDLISSRRSKERDLIVAMVATRILKPKSKLATTLQWHDTTLPEILDVVDANEDDLYRAMDWLIERQEHIEKKLADRHMERDGLVLYDLTSSYFEGETCPLAARGHNRDGKKGKLQVNYGLLTNARGIPVSVSVFEGNTGDPKTLLPQVEKACEKFGIDRFVLVGDRGMLTQKQVDALKDIEGVDWIGALRPDAIKSLVKSGKIQLGLFDECNLFELAHPNFPDERLVACRNPMLAHRRAEKRKSLLEATAEELSKVRNMVGRGRLLDKDAIRKAAQGILKKYKIGKHFKLDIRDNDFEYKVDEQAVASEIESKYKGKPKLAQQRIERCQGHKQKIVEQLDKLHKKIEQGQLYGKDKIGVRVGKVLNKYKVGKHFKLDIRDDSFEFEIDEEKVAAEAVLDGIYVVRTNLPQERMDADQTVLSYKLLSQAERAFRSFKTVDLLVRPIHHRLEDRVRAHIFLCMLSYYVLWHMIEAWRPLTYGDENQEAKTRRNPVAPAQRSREAMRKARTKCRTNGARVYDFRSLLDHLARIVRNTCRCTKSGQDAPTFPMDTPPNPTQREALSLLKTIKL